MTTQADEKRLALEADKKRLDWLADPSNHIGNVQLPTEAVMANPHSLRAAIDAAMEMTPNAGLNRPGSRSEAEAGGSELKPLLGEEGEK